MCMIDGADEWTVFRSETRRAAKSHKCYECGRSVESGESYEYATGLLDGRWLTMHTCAQCVELKRWLTTVCNGYLFGGVWEDIEQHWSDDWLYRSLAFGRIVVHMRDRKLQTFPPERVKELVDSALAALPCKVAA